MTDNLIERRAPVDMYLYKAEDHSPLDAEGLGWLADQLCSDNRVHEDRTMSVGWIPYQAAYEFPHLWDRIQSLEAQVAECRKRTAEEELKAATGTLAEAIKDLRKRGFRDAAELIESKTMPETKAIFEGNLKQAIRALGEQQ